LLDCQSGDWRSRGGSLRGGPQFEGGGAAAIAAASSGNVGPIFIPDETNALARCTDSLVFEGIVNEAGKAGYLKKLNIPKGSKFIDLRYSSNFGYKLHGPDGFFIAPDGKVTLLEMKWSKTGSLGEITGKIPGGGTWTITQGSPEWVQKAMLKVRAEDPARFRKIRKMAKGTKGFKRICDAVDYFHKNMDDIVDELVDSGEYPRKGLRRMIENFADPELTRRILEKARTAKGKPKFKPKFFDEIGEFWGKHFSFGAVNKTGARPRRVSKVSKAIAKSAEAFGGSAVNLAKRVLWAGLHKR
jgi:hypothetical protein